MMLPIRNSNFLIKRQIHSGIIANSEVKHKLKYFQKNNILLGKTSKELKKIKRKKEQNLKVLHKTPYSKQHAIHLLNKKYSTPRTDSTQLQIGPMANDDVKYLSLTKDKRMMYTILGISGEQLRDSKLINDVVVRFLSRNQVEKAIWVVRLSKTRGAPGLNSILKYYLKELNQPQAAIKLYNWSKKWNIPKNEYTHTILFSGLSQNSTPLTKKVTESTYNIIEMLLERDSFNQIEYNSALSALSNSVEVTPMLKLFDRKIPGIYNDSQSYTMVIRGISKIDSDELFIEVFNKLMNSIPAKRIDNKLLFEICNTLNKRNNSKFSSISINALNKYFNITSTELPTTHHQDTVLLPSLKDWNIEKKFSINKHIFGLLLNASLKSGNYKYGITIFKEIANKIPEVIDLAMYNNLISITTESDPNNCAVECLKIFEILEKNSYTRYNKQTIVLMNKAFIRQSLKSSTYDYSGVIENFFNSYLKFLKAYDGQQSKLFKTSTLSKEAWKFVFVVWKNLDKTGKIPGNLTESLVQEFMKSITVGMFDVTKVRAGTKKDAISSEIYLLLESVRLISKYTENFMITNITDVDVNKMTSEERKKFLFRRLLLRYKKKLLERVGYLEQNKLDKIDNDMEYLIKKWSTMILTKDIPNVEIENSVN